MKTNLIKGLIFGFTLLLFISPNILSAQFNPGKQLRGPDPTTVTSNFTTINYTAHLNGAHTVKWLFNGLEKVGSFTVMVSDDNTNFSNYKDITTSGSATSTSRFFTVYIDEFVGTTKFIKLRANYGDGTFEDSESREVLFFASKKTEISTWPNPVMVDVQIADIDINATDLIIYDQQGSIKRTERVNTNEATKSLNLSSYKTGFYHIILLDNNGRLIQSKRIFKQ